ncbi:MAG: diadenosine tetraphosphate (Ap4A) HIT family hydrolase [Kiritimatiellia bacterium]|jgi:diadenosine tetraphosphate (Ap4A) HIT family hydrolase
MPTLIHERVRQCQAGEYPKAICRLSSGWVVLGDVQFLRGYSLLLPDPVVPHLNEMGAETRKNFLYEMSVVGDVILEITGAVRINYEMLGNIEPALHAHIFPRFEDEPDEFKLKPVWFYDWDKAPEFDASRDREIMQAIAKSLDGRGLII